MLTQDVRRSETTICMEHGSDADSFLIVYFPICRRPTRDAGMTIDRPEQGMCDRESLQWRNAHAHLPPRATWLTPNVGLGITA